ncbi:MAG: response regulator [Candidatus Aminicenantes bacterium]|nr:MAG: response regulator [Candidatus Aminicenantes bacterium]
MSRKTIVLADNSYTIRRIVELSFSDEKDIELVTFENGLNLKEKLLELRPQIVLVDIKLPEFTGYDVCKFVQGSEALEHTKIFLLKGGFEPIDETLLQDLKYENIITKPFDSNALVANIKNLLAGASGPTPPGTSAEVPSSLPEDEELPEIETIPEPGKEINFSDVKEDIDTGEIITDEDELGPVPGAFPDDEVLPSEEITRAQPDKDTISPTSDDEENPFADEMPAAQPAAKEDSPASLTEEELNIKRNIEMQEKELAIDSLTLEEINIKRDIERQEREHEQQIPDSDLVISDEAVGPEADTSDMFPESVSKLEPEPQEDFFPFDKQKAEPAAPTIGEPPTVEPSEGEEMFSKEEAQEPEIPDIKYETDIGRKGISILEMEPQPPGETQIPKPKAPPQVEEPGEPEATAVPGAREYEIPDLEIPPTPPAPKFEVQVEEEALELEMDLTEPPPAPPQAARVTAEEKAPEAPPTLEPTPEVKESPGIPHEVILDKIEDKLAMAIKEMLWEIVPPLAEKIIKKEIETLKSETDQSLK